LRGPGSVPPVPGLRLGSVSAPAAALISAPAPTDSPAKMSRRLAGIKRSS
jgi:hypothetical protein